MAGVGCCRRRRIRPQFLLIFFSFSLFAAFVLIFRGGNQLFFNLANSDNRPQSGQAETSTLSKSGNNAQTTAVEAEISKTAKNTIKTERSDISNQTSILVLPKTFDLTVTKRHQRTNLTSERKKAHDLLRKTSGTLDIELLNLYEDRSREPMVYNWNLLKDGGSSVDIVVAVQIHDRASYLAYLFDSFRHVPSWDNAIIVLSHDFYSPEIDTLVKSCTFAPIVEIYYPVSNQLFKRRYPGEDPRDCTRDMNTETAKNKGCYNANYPDKYGHYREARFSQTKLHWIWKLHYIFDEVVPEKLPSFKGRVLLLEEDHYVSPDFLHILRKASTLSAENHRIITLGNYKDMRFGWEASRFAVNKWVSSRLNMGMSLSAQTWRLIKGCVRTFCDFDDYNWDWSLQYAAIQCIEGNLYTLYARSSRVFHIGECAGIHFKNKCVAAEKVESIKKMLSENSGSLFPLSISIDSGVAAISQLKPKANGGWGDPRDRVLCRSAATGSYLDIIQTVFRAQTDPL